MNGVVLAYAGVHQIFQLALAAHELGELERLCCSIVDGPGKWGRRLRRWVPSGTVQPLGSDAIPSDRIAEFPWPLLANRIGGKLIPARRSEHLHSNAWFDRRAARWLRTSTAKVFVGGETCALECLRQAGRMGMKRVLDCPGVPSLALDAEARRAAETFDVKIAPSSNSPAMLERKRLELDAADVVLCCSPFQRDKLIALHPTIRRAEVFPLWTDVEFWSAVADSRAFSAAGQPLQVLYAGAVSLRKGVPYLLQAVEPLATEISLTLVGSVSAEMESVVKRFRQHRHLPYVPRSELRELYRTHDLLVMPTLGDSFGFVSVEAMASGMPVVVSRNAGAPVPDESWRVDAHDAGAIRDKVLAYHADRSLLRHHGRIAAAFGAGFRPEEYRAKARALFAECLAA